MHITLNPQRRDDILSVEVTGKSILINGELFDFSTLNDGDMVQDVPCELIVGMVECVDGDIHLSLILPHGANPSQAVAFPAPIVVTADGPVDLPHDPEPVEPEEPADVEP
ncbi:hypothetical protein [Mesorhizobium sp. CAU 1732]|uniref:hypothetical protein n=1 Tax=Mesorhizobium sp. CAU 1732 TaxID=3140358 RepID=UPI0032601557